MGRVLFPCQNEEEIDKWEENVCCLFGQDTAAVRDRGMSAIRNEDRLSEIQVALAPEYLKGTGINCENLNQDERALIVCQRLWLDMQSVEPEALEAPDQAGGSKRLRVSGRFLARFQSKSVTGLLYESTQQWRVHFR